MLGQLIENEWASLLEEEFKKPYFTELEQFLQAEYETETIYPASEDIFNALKYTSFNKVKVVLLGQDPYHGPNQAHGLSFSVRPEVTVPPSLKNIFKELHQDTGCPIPDHGHLTKWAREGVLLLNTILTVKKGQAHSHKGKGWEMFTDQIIRLLNSRETPLVFILWGKPAQSKLPLIDTDRHFIITSPHPSPFSANKGFFGSSPFSTANRYLEQAGLQKINWCIEDTQ
ncbi:uracil-DNA glycosylase [Peribacillus deserti]|uniref:Uracil-DNA glycosylase n=1 Tax=Peribacillus deserti TaxID=673318 RepID=A0ABS2QDQ0_9BACI|nr:uracil-DNA glycosylase [Peribacillus deserti]MBM7690623.1 uracil-DNA glycosylase [Peribacillus deserti]